jgi:hypothetical protein
LYEQARKKSALVISENKKVVNMGVRHEGAYKVGNKSRRK